MAICVLNVCTILEEGQIVNFLLASSFNGPGVGCPRGFLGYMSMFQTTVLQSALWWAVELVPLCAVGYDVVDCNISFWWQQHLFQACFVQASPSQPRPKP
jgi:hypothetical protein